MPQIKRSRSCSSIHLSSKHVATTTSLTPDALNEHELNTLPVSTIELLEMAGQRIIRTSQIPIPSTLPPSSPLSPTSRPSSPTRLSDANYRYRVLNRARISIDDEIPVDVQRYIDTKIFGPWAKDESLLKVSEDLWVTSKQLAMCPSVELDWLNALHATIYQLIPPGLKIASNRDWREDLKPEVRNPLPTIPQKRRLSNQLVSKLEIATQDTLSPSINLVEKTTPVFKLKDPRPDVCIGLSDAELKYALVPKKGSVVAELFLEDLQEDSILISDPHVTPLGLRFPFLIVEAKAAATGGNLYQAQNQAAVSGSAALRIFGALSDLQDLQEGGQEITGNTTGLAEGLAITMLRLAFSITTEGPIHELWLHFQRPREEKFYMVCLGTWRTTLRDSTLDLVQHISAVLRWGMGELKENIISIL